MHTRQFSEFHQNSVVSSFIYYSHHFVRSLVRWTLCSISLFVGGAGAAVVDVVVVGGGGGCDRVYVGYLTIWPSSLGYCSFVSSYGGTILLKRTTDDDKRRRYFLWVVVGGCCDYYSTHHHTILVNHPPLLQ